MSTNLNAFAPFDEASDRLYLFLVFIANSTCLYHKSIIPSEEIIKHFVENINLIFYLNKNYRLQTNFQ